MEWQIFLSSGLLSLVILTTLATKWRIKLRTGVAAGIVIGLVTSLFVNRIAGYVKYCPFQMLLVIEFLFVILITVIVIITRFFRDPERVIPQENYVIISPADGVIRYVQEIKDGQIPTSIKGKSKIPLEEMTKTNILNDGGYLIGIEMSILDVHVNRAPIEGKIIYQKPTRGNFLSLKSLEALFSNERVTIVIDNGTFKIGIIQIASRLVRRIVSFLTEGEWVLLGERIGMIKFGSQVDLVIPKLESIKINVKIGDHVKAGSTILCEYGGVDFFI